MKHHIIGLEGLPGSGKTTYLRRLEKDLKTSVTIKKYEEGELNPIDLGYCAVMSKATYAQLLDDFHDIQEAIKNVSMMHDDFVVTAYTKVARPSFDDPFYQTFGQYELHRYADFSTFKATYMKLWKAFAKQYDAKTIYFFGGAFLQNHFELLFLHYNLSKQAMQEYFKAMMKALAPLNPLILYIQESDIKKTILSVAKQRQTSDHVNFKDWIEMVIESFEAFPSAKEKGYRGFEGALKFYHDEQQFELDLLKTPAIASHVFKLNDDYDAVYQQILKAIQSRLDQD